jgi:hypothetical protein
VVAAAAAEDEMDRGLMARDGTDETRLDRGVVAGGGAAEDLASGFVIDDDLGAATP